MRIVEQCAQALKFKRKVHTFRNWRLVRAWARTLKIWTNTVVLARMRRLMAGALRALVEHSVRRYMHVVLDTADCVVTAIQERIDLHYGLCSAANAAWLQANMQAELLQRDTLLANVLLAWSCFTVESRLLRLFLAAFFRAASCASEHLRHTARTRCL